MIEDLIKMWGPFGVAVVAACLAWWYRRQERIDDAYADWAGALYRYAVAALARQEPQKAAEKMQEALSDLYASRARVLLLERNGNLRAAVDLLSDVSELGADSPERVPPSPPAIPAGMWPAQFFFERKLRRVDLFVADLSEAGFFERWKVSLREPTWEPLPPRRD